MRASPPSYTELVFVRLSHRRRSTFVYTGAAVLSVVVATLLTRTVETTTASKPLLAVAGLIGVTILLSLPPRLVFLGWLFFAPIVGAAIDVSRTTRVLGWSLYIAPALVLALWTLARRHARPPSRLDLIPAAYVAYAFASLLVTNHSVNSVKAFLQVVLLGVIVYYFLTIGPGREIPRSQIVSTILAAGSIQGAFAVIERVTSWNLWSQTYWQHNGVGSAPRAVATLSNPGVLGMFLGVAIVIAVAVVGWDGPQQTKRLALLALVLCIPGLVLTLTRGPILATAIAASVILILGPRTRLLALGLAAVITLALAFMLPTIRTSSVYKDRVSGQANIQGRLALQSWSFRLAGEKPVLGWGYGSFDRAKNEVAANSVALYSVSTTALTDVLTNTSHDTYLTVLVELGGVGFALLILPWVAIAFMTLRRARAPSQDRWLLMGGVASLMVIMLTAVTLDFRFFSFAEVLPWVIVAILRGLTHGAESPAAVAPRTPVA
jgi:O-antigen ligase